MTDWMTKFGGTRSQVRRIVHGVGHDTTLDGEWVIYRERFQKVNEVDWGFSLRPLLNR